MSLDESKGSKISPTLTFLKYLLPISEILESRYSRDYFFVVCFFFLPEKRVLYVALAAPELRSVCFYFYSVEIIRFVALCLASRVKFRI